MPDESVYHNHRLTRDGMKRQIAEGGSVMYKGPQDLRPRIITNERDLPNEAELAGHDPTLAPTVHAKLERLIKDATAQLEQLSKSGALQIPEVPDVQAPPAVDTPPVDQIVSVPVDPGAPEAPDTRPPAKNAGGKKDVEDP